MPYEDSWLWRTAFTEAREGVSTEEQAYFRERYLSMRGKASLLVARIGADMKDMTVHDVTHLDALWEMGSILTRDIIRLNPPEAFVFGGAILLHDAAMSLAAYPDGVAGLKQEVVWKDSYARLTQLARDRGVEPDQQTEALATADALRSLHAKQAERLVKMAWKDAEGHDEYLIDDPEVRRFYGPRIGKIAHSHWWDVSRLEDEFAVDLGPLGGRTDHRIDLLKVAALLRLSDALHIDRRRAPTFLRLLIQPEGVSAAHWKYQERMAVPFIEKGALIYSAASSFELTDADAWWLAYDALSMIDEELRAVDQLMQRRGTPRFLASRVEGAGSPQDVSQLVETEGWTPVNTAVRVSDVPKIVSMLGGAKLYGDKPEAAIRELLQNAADAIKARRKVQNRAADWGCIVVTLDERDSAVWLTIEDTGVGMSQAVLTGPLIDFGNSFWRSSLAAQEFPGLQAAGIEPTGKYGIGFFSTFMLGNFVRVTSRRYDKASNEGAILEFANGLSSRPILYGSGNNAPIDGGTRVEIRLDIRPEDERGLLRRSSWSKDVFSLRAYVAAVAPALDVNIEVVEDGVRVNAVDASDWLSLDEVNLYSRLAPENRPSDDTGANSRLRDLIGSDGKVYGRARIEVSEWGSGRRGCLVVGGLRAASIGILSGLIAGRENTAARDDAVVSVPEVVLSSWASEQAILLSASGEDDEDKARGANAILACGGSVQDLPVARIGEKWIGLVELQAIVSEADSLWVSFEDPVRYDEDRDDVLPRDFKSSFIRDGDVLFIPDNLPGFVRQDKIASIVTTSFGSGQVRSLKQLFKQVLSTSWNEFVEETESAVVGSVDGSNIERPVSYYVRV